MKEPVFVVTNINSPKFCLLSFIVYENVRVEVATDDPAVLELTKLFVTFQTPGSGCHY